MTHDPDARFFQQHPDRQARIREPMFGPHINGQRAIKYQDESEELFRSLGPHPKHRRRILVWRTPADHPTHPNRLLQIPFLLNGDETVEDRDDILLPIIRELMLNAASASR